MKAVLEPTVNLVVLDGYRIRNEDGALIELVAQQAFLRLKRRGG